MTHYNIIAEQEHTTVMAHYEALPREETGYQREAELEAAFIKQLTEQGYERVNITTEAALIANLRRQMERLNGLTLSDKEWKQLFEQHIASPQMTIEDKTERIQRTEIVNITRDNGESQNIRLIDKRNVHNNHVQVLNQYVPEGGTYANLRTTAQAFGGEPDEQGKPTRPLHTYTIIDAIRDKNVLQFKVDYIQTVKMKDDVGAKQVWGTDTDEALASPQRITNNVAYILEHYGQKTKQHERYAYSVITNVVEVAKNNKTQEEKRKNQLGGFNSILCTDSIPSAIKYYKEFKKQQEAKPEGQRLRIATIFTYSANEAEDENGLPPDEDPGNTEGLDATSREFLESALADYNGYFGTKYTTEGESFQNYYKDLSLRMKNREVDMLIVVSMFLTGFDAKTLNTLWVDKNLKMHGLLQAYSRTNRILNSIKDCGNIVCFRNLEEATNESFALFGDKDAAGVVLMRPFADYYFGYDDEKGRHVHGYKEIVEMLLGKYRLPITPMTFTLEEKKEFVKLFGGVLKMQNLLSAFDEFTGDVRLISDFDVQDYLTWYNDLHEELRPTGGGEKDSIEDDLIFEMELVKQIQINIPYILQLVKQYHEKNCEDKTIIAKIQKYLNV
ncbi:MAG: hypothetical protein IJ511_06770 [Bacteroides sp.]|nr:hypothetical protein [Bacteroides sp.]